MLDFDNELLRFGTCGTLIALYGLADGIARRRERGAPAGARPRWVKVVIFVSLLGFYALIGPTGGPLLDGLGNAAGLALALLAMGLRLASGAGRGRDLAPRLLFYLALPAAIGVPWGWLAFTLPAWAASLRSTRPAPVAAPASTD
jgi:hypothetical protein